MAKHERPLVLPFRVKSTIKEQYGINYHLFFLNSFQIVIYKVIQPSYNEPIPTKARLLRGETP